MEAALQAVRNGMVSVIKAALLHSVPTTTLKDRLSGRVTYGTKPGPVKYLNDEEEHTFSDYLVNAAKTGYGKTRKQVKAIVENVAIEKTFNLNVSLMDGGDVSWSDTHTYPFAVGIQLLTSVWTL